MMKPSSAQVRIWHLAITTLAVAVIVGAVCYVLYWLARVAGLLQPILIPIAVAVVIAYLLDPVVNFICRKTRWSRLWGTTVVFAVFFAGFLGLSLWILPAGFHQGSQLVRDLPQYSEKVQRTALGAVDQIQKLAALPIFQKPHEGEAVDPLTGYASTAINNATIWLQEKAPDLAASALSLIHI